MKKRIAHYLRQLAVIAALFTLSCPTALAEPPVQVYLLVGQSNMQGKGAIEGDGTNTLRHMVQNDPEKQYQSFVGNDGQWVERKDVWIHYDLYPFRELRYGLLKPGYGASSGQVGPELGFGHAIGDVSKGKVLIIKAAWGGKSLGHNFLPPSIGKYPLPVDPNDPGYFYHRTLQLVSEVTRDIENFFPDYTGQGIEIAGLCWHQGWNDQYGELDQSYETNLAAFINDIRSAEHGLGIPNLPVVIATSGMIEKDSLVKDGQRAMGDTSKYPQFAGNVSVVDTDQPYGPDKMAFKFYTKKSPDSVGYHWNNHARSYTNIGVAMASEMLKLDQPQLPARLVAFGSEKGVQLNWQLGSIKPEGVEIRRNGKRLDVALAPTQTEFIDPAALPGVNSYEVLLELGAGEQKLSASSDTSVAALDGYRSLDGVMLSWEATGKYKGFRLSRDGKVIAEDIAGDTRSFEDTNAPETGKVVYTIKPKRGKTTPAELKLNLGPLGTSDAGGALVYEPFNYPANVEEAQSLIGKSGALGTKGAYVYSVDKNLERVAATLAGGLEYGDMPVNGNRGSSHRWCAPTYIELDDSLQKAGLLEDGATLWMSYVFISGQETFPGMNLTHRTGGGTVTLQSADMQQGVGFAAGGRQYDTAVVLDGKMQKRRITGTRSNTATLVVGRLIWGKDGENDSFIPFHVGPDLKLPEKEGRASVPFNIDQTKLSRLVLSGEGQFDEIRVGPTFDSVVGGGTHRDSR